MGEKDTIVEYLKSLNPKKEQQHILIYGSIYKLWREGKYLGEATWKQDNNVGDSFQTQKINDTGELVNAVYVADKWELVF